MQSIVFADTERMDEMARLFAHLQASLHATTGTTASGLPPSASASSATSSLQPAPSST